MSDNQPRREPPHAGDVVSSDKYERMRDRAAAAEKELDEALAILADARMEQAWELRELKRVGEMLLTFEASFMVGDCCRDSDSSRPGMHSNPCDWARLLRDLLGANETQRQVDGAHSHALTAGIGRALHSARAGEPVRITMGGAERLVQHQFDDAATLRHARRISQTYDTSEVEHRALMDLLRINRQPAFAMMDNPPRAAMQELPNAWAVYYRTRGSQQNTEAGHGLSHAAAEELANEGRAQSHVINVGILDENRGILTWDRNPHPVDATDE